MEHCRAFVVAAFVVAFVAAFVVAFVAAIVAAEASTTAFVALAQPRLYRRRSELYPQRNFHDFGS